MAKTVETTKRRNKKAQTEQKVIPVADLKTTWDKTKPDEVEAMADLFVKEMGDMLYARVPDKSENRSYPLVFRMGLKEGFMQAVKFQRMKEAKHVK